MSQKPSFTPEKVKELLDLPPEQREEALDRIVISYMNKMDSGLAQLDTANLKEALAFFKSFINVEIWDLAVVLTFAAKPKHRAKISSLWENIHRLYTKHTKKK